MPNRWNLLLDSHILVWWLAESRHLSKIGRKSIEDAGLVCVSAATIWEISIKAASGKLEIRGDLEAHLDLNHFRSLPITVAHALAAARLPKHHTDPFDRMLVAQASMESLRLLTADERLTQYGPHVILV